MEPVPAQGMRGARRPDGQLRVASWVDQVARREAFEAAHPDVKIQAHTVGQPWTALAPGPDGSDVTVTDRRELGGLLDKLELLVAVQDAVEQPEGGR